MPRAKAQKKDRLIVLHSKRGNHRFRWAVKLRHASQKRVHAFWLRALNQTLSALKKTSPFYKKALRRTRLPLQNFDQITELPLTTKEDLRKNNRAFFASPPPHWADMFASSGTTGEPVLFPQTASDLLRTQAAEVQALTFSGVKPSDTVLLHMPIHGQLWGAGLSYYLGYQTIGACVLRTGPANIAYQIPLIQRIKPTVLHTNAALALHLAAKLTSRERACFRLLILGLNNIVSEDGGLNDLGKSIQKSYPKARLNPVYGITESASPWHSCAYSNAYHITPAFSIVEVLSSQEKKPVPRGEKGVLVLTPLFLEGLPLLRYITNDVAAILPHPCRCGHPLLLSSIAGRIDQQIKIKGVTLFPEAIETIIRREKKIKDYYLVVRRTATGLDKLTLYLLTEAKSLASLQLQIQQQLGIRPVLRRVKAKTVRQKVFAASKPKRFFDLR